MPVDRMAMRRKHIVPWVVDLIVTAVGAWVAALLVPAFDLSGAVGEQVVAVAVVTVTFVAATAVVPIPLFRTMRRAYTRNMSDLMEEPDFDVPDKQFFAPVRRMFTLGLVNAAIRLLIYLVLAPAALWLASTALGAAGLPTRLSGFWPTVVAALVVLATRSVLSRLLRWPFGRARARRYIGGLAEYVLTVAALLVALAVLAGASVVAEPDEPVALSVIVFTGLYVLGDFELTVPFLTTAIRITINGRGRTTEPEPRPAVPGRCR